MLFYNNLKAACDRKGLKISPVVVECGGALGSISKWKNGASPNSDIVIKLALRLNVTSDYLLGLDDIQNRKEKSSEFNLSNLELEALEKFNKLETVDKGRILDRMETIYASYSPEQKENVS